MKAYLIFVAVLIVLALGAFVYAFTLYLQTKRTMKNMDDMLNRAIGNTFEENVFSEESLSKLESKMHRYLVKVEGERKKLDNEKSSIQALISDISHQTKTPLANVSLYSQLLSEEKDLTDSQRQLSGRIREQTDKLTFLIDSLVKLSRLENGTIAVNPAENSVDRLLKEAHGAFSLQAREQGRELILKETAKPLMAVFDYKWTLEALSNIIDNALKYTEAGRGIVRISAVEYEMFMRIDVADNGMGIDEKDQPKIFSRFYRAQEASDERGVGIGLYLAREILTKEGGYIKVESKKGEGSVFSLFLPKGRK